MISFDLKCRQGHVFEGWFRSSADYDQQRGARLIACPLCGDADIAKAVMAPAVAAKGNRKPSPIAPSDALAMAANQGDEARLQAMMAALAEAQSKMLEKSEWVGDKFADLARAMHYGEADQAAIHGTTSADEAREMIEEGVQVAPLIVPITPPDRTH